MAKRRNANFKEECRKKQKQENNQTQESNQKQENHQMKHCPSAFPPATVASEPNTQSSNPPSRISAVLDHSRSVSTPQPLFSLTDEALQVIEASIVSIKVDVIVNSIGRRLDLSAGVLSNAIGQTAGPGMDLELNQYSGNVSNGDILKTHGFDLLCLWVLHVVLNGWVDEDSAIQSFRQLLKNLFLIADVLEAKSIAIPAIGAGRLHYPKHIVAEVLFSEASEYLVSRDRKNLRKIALVVNPGDSELLDIYSKLLQNSKKRSIVEASKQLVDSSSFPKQWSPSPSFGQLYKRLEVFPLDAEYEMVIRQMRSQGGDAFVNLLYKIERIENRKQYGMLQSLKKSMVQPNGKGVENERFLWHGTSHDAVENIMNFGFNRNYGGKNAMSYGNGVYFAVNFSYSAQDPFAIPHNGFKHIFLARVLTGSYGQGEPGLKEPPFKDAAKQTRYDSTVNNVNNPTIFVTFRDYTAYPEYLITIYNCKV